MLTATDHLETIRKELDALHADLDDAGEATQKRKGHLAVVFESLILLAEGDDVRSDLPANADAVLRSAAHVSSR